MTLTVIVPTFRRPEGLRRCLEGLAGQSVPPDEVLVVHRPAEDPGTADFLAHRDPSGDPAHLRAVPVDAPGLVAALSAGVAAARTDVIAATDDDAVPRPDWVERMLRHYAPGVGGVGGRDFIHTARGVADGRAVRVGGCSWLGHLSGNHHIGSGPPQDVDVLKGVNISLRRELWRFECPLAGRGAQAHSELFLCLRARRLGYRLIYDPLVAVDHFPAPRPAGDERGLADPADAEAAAYNEALALLRYASPGQAAARALFRLVVGQRTAPGWLRAGAALLRGDADAGRHAPAMRALRRAVRTRWAELAHAPAAGPHPAPSAEGWHRRV